MSRRRLLAGVTGGLGGALLVQRLGIASTAIPAPLRPPGSLPEAAFLASCTRCGVCLQSCPTNVIQLDLSPSLTMFLAPKLVMRLGGCDPDCRACGRTCPTGAIRPLSLSEKRRAVIGKAALARGRCLRARGADCRICVAACPYDAMEMMYDTGALWPVVVDSRCNGCGLCELRCPVPVEDESPFDAQAAIRVVATERAARLSGEPVEAGPSEESYLPPFLRGV